MLYGSAEYQEAFAELPPDVQARLEAALSKPVPYRHCVVWHWTNPDAGKRRKEWKQSQCGARCRDGHACRRRPVWNKARCKNHGGRSTGPKTPEGRAAIAESNRRRAQTRTEEAHA